MAVAPEVLRSIPFLAGLKDRDLRSLASSMQERQVPQGKDIVVQGTGGIAFFVVLEGSAAVTVDGEQRGTLGPGDSFGETALIVDDLPRTATVTATAAVRVASLTVWNFRPFVRDHPDVAWSLLETLARRLARTPQHH